MHLFKLFHAVKEGTTSEKVAFWRLCKSVATANGAPAPVGLTKVALDIWADAYESGANPGADRAMREAFAGSFGCAVVAENELSKLAADGLLSSDEFEKVAAWVAESAVNDLVELTRGVEKQALFGFGKGPAPHAAPAAKMPPLTVRQFEQLLQQGTPGIRVGRSSYDPDVLHAVEEHPEHGLMVHAYPTSILEEVASDPEFRKSVAENASGGPNYTEQDFGYKLADIMQGLDQGGQPPMNADVQGPPAGEPPGKPEMIAEPSSEAQDGLEGVDKAHQVVDNMIFLAQQVQMPQLAQELEQNRDSLAAHFSDGNAYLPPELQHHFVQSEHAEAFMKKYKQRFGVVGGGSKKVADFSYGPVDYASDGLTAAATIGGGIRGGNHGKYLRGAIRGAGGSLLGRVGGVIAGNALMDVHPTLDNEYLRLALESVGGVAGAHLATKKYLSSPEEAAAREESQKNAALSKKVADYDPTPMDYANDALTGAAAIGGGIRGGNHGKYLRGAMRGVGGSVLGRLGGTVAGNALKSVHPTLDNEHLRAVLEMLGGATGAHLATKK